MKFVKVGGHIINLSQIVRVEVMEGRIDIHFSESESNFSLYDQEANALVDVLEAKDLLEKSVYSERGMRSLEG
jgi:hypothetical protein